MERKIAASRSTQLSRCGKRCKQREAPRKSWSIPILRMGSMLTIGQATERNRRRMGGNDCSIGLSNTVLCNVRAFLLLVSCELQSCYSRTEGIAIHRLSSEAEYSRPTLGSF